MIRFILMAFTAGVIAGWFGRGIWEESAERDALVSQIEAQRKDVHKQAKAEQDEQEQQRHDAHVVAKTQDSVSAVDYSHCPDISAEYFRMLNAIGTEAAAAEFAGEVPMAGMGRSETRRFEASERSSRARQK